MASGRTWGKRILIALGVVVALVVVLIAAAFGYLVYLKVPPKAPRGSPPGNLLRRLRGRSRPQHALRRGRHRRQPDPEHRLGQGERAEQQRHRQDAGPVQSDGFAATGTQLRPRIAAGPQRRPVPTVREPGAVAERRCRLPQAQWPAGVDATALNSVVQQAFVGSGDIAAANARGWQSSRMARRCAAGGPLVFQGIPLHGWSMTKSVAGMLAYKVLMANNVPPRHQSGRQFQARSGAVLGGRLAAG